MKSKILDLLRAHTGDFISGSDLSKQLGVTRMAIWKHIEDLRDQGYRIESTHGKGYSLVAELDLFDPDVVKAELSTLEIGSDINFYSVIETTQHVAHQLAKEGSPHGTVVVADRQLAGKGRLGRSWHSASGAGIWASFILRPLIALQSAPQMTLLMSVAVARALTTFGYKPQIKWPNDILIEGKKVCGILTELQADPDRIKYIIVGIGINVHQQIQDFPEDLQDQAISLAIADPQTRITRNDLFRELCVEINHMYDLYLKHGFGPIKMLWESYALNWDHEIMVKTIRATLTGVAKGITDEGILLVEDENGQTHHIYSGDIELK